MVRRSKRANVAEDAVNKRRDIFRDYRKKVRRRKTDLSYSSIEGREICHSQPWKNPPARRGKGGSGKTRKLIDGKERCLSLLGGEKDQKPLPITSEGEGEGQESSRMRRDPLDEDRKGKKNKGHISR